MHKLIIKNFGPIKETTIEVNDFMFFIGPQASGKSTVSKCIFFFKSIKDDLIRFLVEIAETKDFEKPLGFFGKTIRHKFLDFWGPTFHLSDVLLKYYYSNNIWISIVLEPHNKFVTPTFSENFRLEFRKLIDNTKEYSSKANSRKKVFLSTKDMFELETLRKSFITSIEKKVNSVFNENKELLFIPAGRSLMATLSDHLQYFDPKRLDYIMRAYIDKISNSRNAFTKSMRDMVQEKILLTKDAINIDNVNLAEKIITSILKGKYQYDKDGEKIYFSDKQYTKLSFSSSGQQESIWILLLIFLFILENRSVFLVIEEPEAHLYPTAQRDMINLISLLSNINDNQVIVTTHSPYILAALNNLIYANKVASKSETSVKKVITKQIWQNLDNISAFKVEGGSLYDIADNDLGILKLEEIDIASREINEEFDKLYSLDNK